MALIKCDECGKEVSNSAKTCPHCGYRLKKKNIKINLKKDVNKSELLSLILLFLAFFLSFFEISFSRDNYSMNRQLLYKSFNDIMWEFISNLDIVFSIIGIVSIILLAIKTFNISKFKILNKIKNNKMLCYIPTFIYTFIAIIISVLVIAGTINAHEPKYDTYYGIAWGGFWILILLLSSSILLIINFMKSKKERKSLL